MKKNDLKNGYYLAINLETNLVHSKFFHVDGLFFDEFSCEDTPEIYDETDILCDHIKVYRAPFTEDEHRRMLQPLLDYVASNIMVPIHSNVTN